MALLLPFPISAQQQPLVPEEHAALMQLFDDCVPRRGERLYPRFGQNETCVGTKIYCVNGNCHQFVRAWILFPTKKSESTRHSRVSSILYVKETFFEEIWTFYQALLES